MVPTSTLTKGGESSSDIGEHYWVLEMNFKQKMLIRQMRFGTEGSRARRRLTEITYRRKTYRSSGRPFSNKNISPSLETRILK